jgi:hypothetical protein
MASCDLVTMNPLETGRAAEYCEVGSSPGAFRQNLPVGTLMFHGSGKSVIVHWREVAQVACNLCCFATRAAI